MTYTVDVTNTAAPVYTDPAKEAAAELRAIKTLLASHTATIASIPIIIPGTIIMLAGGASVPTGYLLCPAEPTAISRTEFANLFAQIGTVWGVGDGATTFGMPYFPNGYAPVATQTLAGVTTLGENKAHTHADSGNPVAANVGYNPGGPVYAGVPAAGTTGSSGGTANLAAGNSVFFCVKT
jgi:hypothetical protein